MSIIINNNCSDVLFKGKSSESAYLGSTNVWNKTKEAYLAAGTAINAVLNKEAVAFTRSATPPTEEITSSDISRDGDKSVVTWYNTTDSIQYWYSDADIIYMNMSSNNTFKLCAKMASIDTSGWDTSRVTDISSIFHGCSAVVSLDVSDWDVSEVINMLNMFRSCHSLIKLDLSKWDTRNVLRIDNIFYDCVSIVSIDISGWDTSKVINISSVFSGCRKLTEITGLSDINISNAASMSDTFSMCSSLSTLDLHKWDTSKITITNSAFFNCSSLKNIDISTWNTQNVTSYRNMFWGCSKLTNLIYGENFVNTSIASDSVLTDTEDNATYHMFQNCPANKPTGGNWDIGWWNAEGTYCAYAELIKGESFNSAINKSMTQFVRTDTAPSDTITTTDISEQHNRSVVTWYDEPTTTQYIYSKYSKIYSGKSMNNQFYRCENLLSIDASIFDTSNTTSMWSAFNGCTSLTELDLSSWNTSKVTIMNSLISNCTNLSTLNLTGWDTSNVVEMVNMFTNTQKLTNIIYGDKFVMSDTLLDTCSVYSSGSNKTYAMFSGCSANKPTGGNWDLGNWTAEGTFGTFGVLTIGQKINDVLQKETATSFARSMTTAPEDATPVDISYVSDNSIITWYDESSTTQYWYCKHDKVYMNTNSAFIFKDCTKMISIDMDGWDTSIVGILESMFRNCSAVTSLNVSSWNVSYVSNLINTFNGCSALSGSLDLSNWDISNVTRMDSLFTLCKELISINISGWNTSKTINQIGLFNGCSKLSEIIGLSDIDVSNSRSLNGMFISCKAITSLDLSKWDISKVLDMCWMFADCTNLSTITYGDKFADPAIAIDNILANDYHNNATYRMFYKCPASKPVSWTNAEWNDEGTYIYKAYMHGNIQACIDSNNAVAFQRSVTAPSDSITTESLALDGSNTIVTWIDSESNIQYWYSKAEKVYLKENCDGAFMSCRNLKQIDLTGIDMSEVTSMDAFFGYCSSLTTITPSIMNLQNVKSMYNMFQECTSLVNLDISGWVTPNMVNMQFAFVGCSSLASLNISGLDTSKVNSTLAMFAGCSKLTTITYGDKFIFSDTLRAAYTSDNNPTSGMFDSCTANKPNWIGGGWDTNGTFVLNATLTTGRSVNDAINKNATVFKRSTEAPTASVITTDISNEQDNSVVTWYDTTTTQYWYSTFQTVCLNADSSIMFAGLSKLNKLDLSMFDSSNVTNMKSMFGSCYALTEINISTWNTSNVTDMGTMFADCSSLISVDVSNFNTSNVTNMEAMFARCRSLTSVDVSNFNTSNVTNISSMFTSCTSLGALNISNFDMSKVTSAGAMFGAANIENLTWHNADLNIPGSPLDGLQVKVLDLSGAKMLINSGSFFNKFASTIEEVNLSNADFSTTTSISALFVMCAKLKTVNLSGVDTSNISNMQHIFNGCSALTTVTYDDKFMNTGLPQDTLNASDDTNMTYQMFNKCTANKPAWIGGEWDTNGTFVVSIP